VHDNVHVLIDTTPEFRLQCLDNDVRRIDAVLFTHHHVDHVAGLDDLRRFNWMQGGALACYAMRRHIESITRMFSYAFESRPDYPSHKPNLTFTEIDGPFTLHPYDDAPGHLEVTPIPLMHGPLPVLGFRFGDIAYCTDCNLVPVESLSLLEDLDVLILDALRLRPHPTHFNLEEAVECAQRIGARQTYFTHIAHEMMTAEVNESLPKDMALAYDGQIIDV
jgi:phosphoribosyl 1,2-cyclic phosphate phosphodiesterase